MKTNNPSSTPEARKRTSERLKGKPGFFTGRKHSEETKLAWSKKRKGRKRSHESIEKQKMTIIGRCWVYKENITTKIKLEQLDEYLQNGWSRGMAKVK